MSDSGTDHRRDAETALLDLDANQHLWTDLSAPMLIAQRANIAALLAIEARLGQLVELSRTANTIAAFAHPHGALDTAPEFRTARETVRNVLGLDTVAEATEWGAEG